MPVQRRAFPVHCRRPVSRLRPQAAANMRMNTLPYSRMWVAGSQSRLKVGKCAVVPEDPKATGAHARNQHRRVTGRLRLGNGNPDSD